MAKRTLKDQVKELDNAKKVNPLDLSSDQDLSIALMNLISLEEHFVFSGAKTQKTGYYDLVHTIAEMRRDLMANIVGTSPNDAVVCMCTHLLSASMRLMEVGTKALSSGNASRAYQLFDRSYELYSLFWGINMGLIDMAGVQVAAPDIYDFATAGCTLNYDTVPPKQAANTALAATTEPKSMVKKLGAWVKNAVNCCIE